MVFPPTLYEKVYALCSVNMHCIYKLNTTNW